MRESDLLRHIFAASSELPSEVTIPPGDDMGAIRFGGEQILVTVDQLIDEVHFRLATTSVELIGRKAITRNLSDVAAMAALPVAAVAAGALPNDLGQLRADALFDAMRQTAAAYDCPLIGGDIAIHDGPLTLSVTILARSGCVPPVLRSGGRVGDAIFVSGKLGGAWQADSTGGHHLTFEPRILLAQNLGHLLGEDLHAMMDISDGLSTDLCRICEASRVGARIAAELIPRRNAATLDHALNEGEDYELLFAVAPEAIVRLPATIENVRLSKIGQIVAADDGIMMTDQSGERSLHPSGWEHR